MDAEQEKLFHELAGSDKTPQVPEMTPDEILRELIDDTQMYYPEVTANWKEDWEVKLSPTISDVDAVFKYEDVIGLVARFKADLAKDAGPPTGGEDE